MNRRMNRSIPLLVFLVAGAAALGAQDANQTSPYQGVSKPPADDEIITSTIPEAKPPAGQPLNAQPTPQAYVQPAAPAHPASVPYQPEPAYVYPPASFASTGAADGTDSGLVRVAPASVSTPPAQPGLSTRADGFDPDNDIVHPRPMRSGELQEGTNIRVRLLDRLSTVDTEKGQPFRSRVATDVMQGGQVIIPAGAEIDGRVIEVSSGHLGGHGAMRLEPESVILASGERLSLHGEVTSAPGSRNHVVGEGTIRPNSRVKRDSIEYGGAVGAGVVTGAIVAGPVGALTGGLIGAGAITVHLLVSHPQATLESGTTLVFMLTDPLYLGPQATTGN